MSCRIMILVIVAIGWLILMDDAPARGGSDKTPPAPDRVTGTALFETNATQETITMERDPKTNDRVTGATGASQTPKPQDPIGSIHIEPQIVWPPQPAE